MVLRITQRVGALIDEFYTREEGWCGGVAPRSKVSLSLSLRLRVPRDAEVLRHLVGEAAVVVEQGVVGPL